MLISTTLVRQVLPINWEIPSTASTSTWGASFYKHPDNQLKFFTENKLANVKIEIKRYVKINHQPSSTAVWTLAGGKWEIRENRISLVKVSLSALASWSIIIEDLTGPTDCDLFFVNGQISLANFVWLGGPSSVIGQDVPAGLSYCATIGQISNELVWLCNEDKNGQMYESNRFDPLHRQAHHVRDCLSERLQGWRKMRNVL